MRYERMDRVWAVWLATAWGMGLLLASGACGQGPASRPAGGGHPAPAASQPASAPEAADPNVVKVLQDLEQAGLKYATLSADVRYLIEKGMIPDEELRTGGIIIARGEANRPDRLYIRFDTLKQGEGNTPTIKDEIEYALDGEWLMEAKHRIKTLTRYQVVAPGQKVELFRLGKGPFPMPFGQKADDVLEYFQAYTRPPIRSDPNGTVYVKLITRPKYKDDLSFLQLEMWVDAGTLLPVKLITRNKNKDTATAAFSNVRTEAKVDEKLFVIEKPGGWQLNIVPLKKE